MVARQELSYGLRLLFHEVHRETEQVRFEAGDLRVKSGFCLQDLLVDQGFYLFLRTRVAL